MRYIKTIDDITKDGSVDFGAGYEFVEDAKDADAILMRSTDLHGYELPEGIRAIGRCGAGVNNIPVEEYARRGVVVFNSPGANSNAVKEIVIAMMIMSSRGIVQAMQWVRDNAEDPNIMVDAEKAKKAFVGARYAASASASWASATWGPRSPMPASSSAWTSTATTRSSPSSTRGP